MQARVEQGGVRRINSAVRTALAVGTEANTHPTTPALPHPVAAGVPALGHFQLAHHLQVAVLQARALRQPE